MSPVTVLIPTLLRPLVDDRSAVEIPLEAPAPVSAVLDTLADGRPVLARRIRDETGGCAATSISTWTVKTCAGRTVFLHRLHPAQR